ncbi:MAG: hypothetical protein E7316_07550 [Clostridiales bacterium]|nr:hypothetical protein [Clostridiales bacterium]
MTLSGAPNGKGIDAYVSAKLEYAQSLDHTFGTLFNLMFSERENIFWETNDGFSIIKTTYGESADRIRRRAGTLAQRLGEIGLAEDAAVALYMDNSLEWIEMFWSILLCGRRPLLLNLRMSDAMLNGVLEAMQVSAVISDGKQFPCRTILESELGEAETPLPEGACGQEILLMSSGTSENIKVCAYTAAEIFAQISNAGSIIRENKRMKRHYEGCIKQLTLLPFYHVFGLFAVYFWFGFFSRTFVHLPNMNPQTVLNTVRKHKVTHIFAVPLFWDTVYRSAISTIKGRGKQTADKFAKGMRLAARLEDVPVLGGLFSHIAFGEIRENLFGESVQFCITGGSAIRPEVLRFFNAIGYHIANGYGMTEIGITSVELSNKKSVLNSGSIGRPMRSVHYDLAENGSLQVSGDSIAHAIIEGGKRQTLDVRALETHDVMRTEGGRYYIMGRMDDVIISATGENINPDIMEQAFDLPEAEGHCLIAARENDRVVPTLIVSVKPYTMPGRIARLSESIQEQIESNHFTGQIARVVFVSDKLMKPTEIKVNRKRLARDYQAGNLHPIGETERRDEEVRTEIQQRVIQLIAETLDKNADDISLGSDFFLDEGGTSMDYYALAGKLHSEFGIDLSGESTKSLSTVQEICAFLEERLQA